MEFSRGGAVVVPICMFNHVHFNLVKRYDQCRDFTNENQQEADDADTDPDIDVVRHADRPAGYGNDCPR